MATTLTQIGLAIFSVLGACVALGVWSAFVEWWYRR